MSISFVQMFVRGAKGRVVRFKKTFEHSLFTFCEATTGASDVLFTVVGEIGPLGAVLVQNKLQLFKRVADEHRKQEAGDVSRLNEEFDIVGQNVDHHHERKYSRY